MLGDGSAGSFEGERMNIYVIETTGDYAKGLAVVVAQDEDSARSVVLEIPIEDSDDIKRRRIRYDQPDNVQCLNATTEGPSRVLYHYEFTE
jgi:hypothetical protein